jgi:PBSX family phage portal protein
VSTVEVRVIKANESPVQRSNAIPIDEELIGMGVVEPPHDIDFLTRVAEASSSLRPNVDAYATNIDGYAHSFTPIVDLEAENARAFFRGMLKLEKVAAGGFPYIEETEIDAAMFEAKHVMPDEELMLKFFFESCCEGMSFKVLREQTRSDLENTGNGYWEVMRDGWGRPRQFQHVQAHMMRITNAGEPIETEALHRTSDIGLARRKVTRRFRRFVQLLSGTERVWFKDFGDRRVCSSRSGRFYASVDELNESEPGTPQATEMIRFSIYSSRSIYGVPRWFGAMAAVLGTRSSEEINYAYFEDKCIPPMAIFVEDGSLEEGALAKIEDIIRNEIKGQRNFHKCLLLQASPSVVADGAGGVRMVSPKIRIEPLAQFQQSDALFQAYEQNNSEKVGQQFRLPRLLRGQMTDFNRSTAETALDYANTQVFEPLRVDFDDTINRLILPELGVKYWRFKSGAPTVRNPEQLTEMLTKVVDSNILVPREGREVAGDIFNRKFAPINEDWTSEPTARLKGSEASKAVKQLVDMRAGIEARAQSNEMAAHTENARVEHVIELPAERFNELVRPH